MSEPKVTDSKGGWRKSVSSAGKKKRPEIELQKAGSHISHIRSEPASTSETSLPGKESKKMMMGSKRTKKGRTNVVRENRNEPLISLQLSKEGKDRGSLRWREKRFPYVSFRYKELFAGRREARGEELDRGCEEIWKGSSRGRAGTSDLFGEIDETVCRKKSTVGSS